MGSGIGGGDQKEGTTRGATRTVAGHQQQDMDAAVSRVLTIGHSVHPLEAFVALLRRYEVAKVMDIRSTPYSRFNLQFNRESLARSLAGCGIEYVFFGVELGGRSDDPSCYENGRIRYDRVAATPSFRRGLDRVVRDAVGRTVALMCAEKEPLNCHRTLLVAQALATREVAVSHILADGGWETHAASMKRLIAIHGGAQQGELFASPGGVVEWAVARQAERVGYRRREQQGESRKRDVATRKNGVRD